jgi:hypothetical protein
MKTPLEIPDPVFRNARARAAEQGVPLRQFVTEAVQERIDAGAASGKKPWMKLAGGLGHLRKQTARINRLIDQEFERVDLPVLTGSACQMEPTRTGCR